MVFRGEGEDVGLRSSSSVNKSTAGPEKGHDRNLLRRFFLFSKVSDHVIQGRLGAGLSGKLMRIEMVVVYKRERCRQEVTLPNLSDVLSPYIFKDVLLPRSPI